MILNKRNIRSYIKDACKKQGINGVAITSTPLSDNAMLAIPSQKRICVNFNKVFENPETIMGLIWHEIGHMVLHKDLRCEDVLSFKDAMRRECEATNWSIQYAEHINDKDLLKSCLKLADILKEGCKLEAKRVKIRNSVISSLLNKGFEFAGKDTYCKAGIMVKIETVRDSKIKDKNY